VVGLAWSDGPESNARGSAATVRTSNARQVKGDDHRLPGWGLGVGLATPPHKKYTVLRGF